MLFQSYFFFLSIQFLALLLFPAGTAAVEVSTFWLQRFGYYSHGRTTDAILDQRTDRNGDSRSSVLFLFIICFAYCISELCGHGSSRRCPREAAAYDSTVTVATSGGCGGGSPNQDCGGGGPGHV